MNFDTSVDKLSGRTFMLNFMEFTSKKICNQHYPESVNGRLSVAGSLFGMPGPSDGAREKERDVTDKTFSSEARSENEQNSCRTVNKGK